MPSPVQGRLPWTRRVAGLMLVLLPLTTGCRTDGEAGAAPGQLGRGGAQAALASHPVPTRTGIHRVHGRLPVARRKAVRTQVGAVVDGWWEAAYLGGDYPRGDFPKSFPGFTDAAQERAREDKALLTNQSLGPRVDTVTATERTVTLDILATGGRARAVTAHVVLRFDTTGELDRSTTVRGRLFLVHQRGSWRVFGYDIAKGAT